MVPLRKTEDDNENDGKKKKGKKNDKVDLYDISKPKEIFGKYSEKWCDNLLKKENGRKKRLTS